ncbi:VOC family protein [Bradyrhizobium prioriisuperbiae]|uniref:VOC family protein n=1 Tax=Bradyrhizobium prioriisuperbiae TaxID=2854389 RepID=UPI0028EC2BF8|nr:VOC family protein [Bradyrhizobium prioritasuperba]
MRLEHANLATSDVAGLTTLFIRFLGFELVEKRGKETFALLRNQDGFVLTLMKRKATDPDSYPATFHLGLYCDTPEQVRAKHAELKTAGFSVGDIQTPDRGGDVTAFYCTSPGNILIEVATPPGWRSESMAPKA